MSGHVGAMADRPTAPMKLKSTEFYELVRAIGRFFFIDALFFSRSLSFSLSFPHLIFDFPLCHRERFCAKISLDVRGHFCAVPGGGWSRFNRISSHQNETSFSLSRARSSILRLLVFIHSRARNDILPQTGECKNKMDEDQIVKREAHLLKHLLSHPKVNKNTLKELLLRLVYVEMLDHDASFGQIYAVKATHESDLSVKRQAYLACSHILDDKSELIMLLINTMQHDLASSEYLVVCAALNAIAKLITDENNAIPALLPSVEKLLDHANAHVRKKAVLCLQKFATFSPESTSHLGNSFRRMLCDRDPSVMFASLCVLRDLCEREAGKYVNLVPSFVSILKQIVERRLPTSYDYHKVPAPFAQIKILKILGILGSGDREASKQAYEVIQLTMKKAQKAKSSTGDGILLECVFTIAKIYPNRELLEQCEEIVRKFINRGVGEDGNVKLNVSSSDRWRNANLKYAALDALAKLAPRLPDCAAEHQMHIVDSLDSEDESVRAKTFDLLSKITTANNCDVIVEKMLSFLRKSNDRYVRADFALKTSQTIEKFAPDAKWFLENTNKVIELLQGDGHEPTIPEFESSALIAERVKNTLREGISGDESTDDEMRLEASQLYATIVCTEREACKPLPRAIVDIACFTIGRYSNASFENVSNTLAIPFESDIRNAPLVLDAYWHLKMRQKTASSQFPDRALKVIGWCASSSDVRTHRVASDLLRIAKDPELGMLFASATANVANSTTVSFDFSAIDTYTQRALANGAKPYSKPKITTVDVKQEEEDDTILSSSAAAAPAQHHVQSPSLIVPDLLAHPGQQQQQQQQQQQHVFPTISPPPRASTTANREEEISESEQRKQKLANDLFGGPKTATVSASSPPTPPVTSATTSTPDSATLLGDLLSGVPSTQAITPSTAPPPSTASPTVDLLGDLLGDISVEGNSQLSQHQHNSNNKNPPQPNAQSSISGGVARASAKKDPFADLIG